MGSVSSIGTTQQPDSTPRRAYTQGAKRKALLLVGLSVLVVALAFVELSRGATNMPLSETLAALMGQGSATAQLVVWNLRMPHILCAIVAGSGLAVAGCVFQGVLHNPLASASTLGITQGAAFGASMAIAVLGAVTGHTVASEVINWDSPVLTAACAFVGATLSMVVIALLATRNRLSAATIVLAGVALGAMFTGGTAIIQYFADDTKVAAIVFWTFGSLRRATYTNIALMAVVVALCAVFFQAFAWKFNAMAAGDETAHSLGVRVAQLRLAGLLLATLCASTVIAFCGTVNFIGLVAPHIMRRVVGADFRYLLPGSLLCGALLMQLSDIASTLFTTGAILPIGAVTSFVGVPFFIWIIAKEGRHE